MRAISTASGALRSTRQPYTAGADDGVAYKELEATSDGDDRCDAGATIQEQPNPGNEAAENRLLDTGGSVNGSRRNNREVLTSTSVVVSGSEPGEKYLDRLPRRSVANRRELLFFRSILSFLCDLSRARSLRQADTHSFSPTHALTHERFDVCVCSLPLSSPPLPL